METALITLHQVVLMLLLIAVGAICARLGWFDDRVARALSKFLLGFVTPALLYFLQIPLPGIAADLISSLASLNTPLAMMVTGVFLSSCHPRDLLQCRVLWPSVVRMAVLPFAFLGLLTLIGIPGWSGGGTLALVVTLCASCPSAASSVLMTSSLGMDSSYGARIIFATSALSVLTVPLVSLAASICFA